MEFFVLGIFWMVAGFLAFLIGAKFLNFKSFDKSAMDLFEICEILGFVSLTIALVIVLAKGFLNFMDNLLAKMNP